MDMSKTIVAKSDQLNADDLMVEGKILKITGIKITNDAQQPVSVNYEGDNGKPFKPCKSMRRVFVKAWGVDEKQYLGRSIKVFCDETVMFGAMAVGGIRISHMSNIDKTLRMLLTATRGRRSEYVVQPLKEEPVISGEELELLISLGSEAASNGSETYTKWGEGLTPEERTAVNHLLRAWFEEAKEVDESSDKSEAQDGGDE